VLAPVDRLCGHGDADARWLHEKAGVELRKANDNWTTVTQLLAEAKAKCSTDGFKAFKKKYCPDLSRSRIYELLQIGSGKKTIEESRAAKRKSVAKSRGKKESATDDVADKSAVGTDKAEYADSGLGGFKPGCEPDWLKQSKSIIAPPMPIETAINTAPEAKPAIPTKATDLARIADLARDCRGLLVHPEQNANEIRKKLSQIIKLSDPNPKDRSKKSAASNAKLDQKLFRRAMALETEAVGDTSTRPAGNDIDTEASADERRAFYAAADDEAMNLSQRISDE
jgi:hypothetical protein